MNKFFAQMKLQVKSYLQLFEECPLPDFLIIGAQKGGTTSLYSYLTQHPGIMPAKKKEVHYFGNPKNKKRGEAWYRSHFPSNSYRESVKRALGYSPITGEATPDMNQPFIPKLVYELLPHAKMIALLRNPIDRAFSQYHHRRKIPGKEPLTFEEAIAQSAITLPDEIMNDASLYYQSTHRSYITRGLYAEQLERWYQYYPKEDIYVGSSEEFFTDPNSEIQKILEFLQMPSFNFDCSVSKNVGMYETKMDQKVKSFLEEVFRPHNRRLYEVIGKDFGWPS